MYIENEQDYQEYINNYLEVVERMSEPQNMSKPMPWQYRKYRMCLLQYKYHKRKNDILHK